MKKPINEFKRMQQLAGINEIKVNKPTRNIADFLNQHKEEVFEEMFSYINDHNDGVDIDIDIDGMSNWEEYEDDDPDGGYICAQTDFPDASIGAQASFEPFPPNTNSDVGDSQIDEVEIAGRKVYYFTYDY